MIAKTRRGSASSTPPAGLPSQAGGSATLLWMKANGVPLTRANFIGANWGEMPDPWTPEHEAELPSELRQADSAKTWGRSTRRGSSGVS